MEGTVVDAPHTIEELNAKAVSKLYSLFDTLDEKSDPEMILACTKGLSQLNASLRGSDILAPKETEEQRKERNAREAILDAMN
jgi:hypothetical protein